MKPTDHIEKRLVHKHHDHNVYVRGIEKLNEQMFISRFSMPALSNAVLRDGECPERHVLLYSEAARQSSMAMCHMYFDVPFEVAFIITDLAIRLSDSALSASNPVSTEDLHYVITILHEEYDKDNRLTSMTVGHAGYAGSTLLVDGEAHIIIQGRYRYERLRGIGQRRFARMAKRLQPATRFVSTTKDQTAGKTIEAAEQAGQTSLPVQNGELTVQSDHQAGTTLSNLQIDATGGRALLQVDENHPFFFDHRNDHLPGMLLLEAAREMAIELERRNGSRSIKTASIEFSNFAEHGYPVELRAIRPDLPGLPFVIQATQGEKNVLSTCLVSTQAREGDHE
jgi:hypothetical protein